MNPNSNDVNLEESASESEDDVIDRGLLGAVLSEVETPSEDSDDEFDSDSD